MGNKKAEQEKIKQIQEKMGFTDSSITPFLHDDHKLPRTRREFLAQGFLGVSTTFVLPSFASMLVGQNTALAQTLSCELPQFSAGLPYLCIDVGGGMNIAGSNIMVGMSSGGEHQEDYGSTSTDYLRLGIASSEHPSLTGKVEDQYGLKFHSASGILEGIKSILYDNDGNGALTTEKTMDNGRPISDGVDGLIFCTRTSDDSAGNPINTVYMANKAGAKGELVQLIGNSSTDTGGRSAAPGGEVNLNLRPSKVSSNNDATGLLSLGNTLSGTDYLKAADAGGQERVKKFMDRISNMSKNKIEQLAKKNSIGQIKDVLNCSSDGAKQLFNKYTASMLNPGTDTAVTDVFGAGSSSIGSVAKLVLDSIAGAGTITLGGGDYHGGAAMTTHATDRRVGQAIGRCILLAKEKKKNIAIHLFTDGGVAGDSGGLSEPVIIQGLGTVNKVKWTGDSGTRSAAMLLVYKHDHDGTPLVRENAQGPRRQVGNFLKNGGVNLSTVIGNNTENLWKAIMLNYLAAQGKEGEFEDFFGRGSLPQDHESLIRMKKIV
jgi:hypothetical protein